VQFGFFPEEADAPLLDEGLVDYGLQGAAAQHLVAADLALRGHAATIAAEGLAYDLIAEIGGLRRIQVKSKRQIGSSGRGDGTPGYLWSSRDGGLVARYSGRADAFAFVALDRRLILWVPVDGMPTKNHLWVPSSQMTEDRCQMSWASLMRGWGLD